MKTRSKEKWMRWQNQKSLMLLTEKCCDNDITQWFMHLNEAFFFKSIMKKWFQLLRVRDHISNETNKNEKCYVFFVREWVMVSWLACNIKTEYLREYDVIVLNILRHPFSMNIFNDVNFFGKTKSYEERKKKTNEISASFIRSLNQEFVL